MFFFLIRMFKNFEIWLKFWVYFIICGMLDFVLKIIYACGRRLLVRVNRNEADNFNVYNFAGGKLCFCFAVISSFRIYVHNVNLIKSWWNNLSPLKVILIQVYDDFILFVWLKWTTLTFRIYGGEWTCDTRSIEGGRDKKASKL